MASSAPWRWPRTAGARRRARDRDDRNAGPEPGSGRRRLLRRPHAAEDTAAAAVDRRAADPGGAGRDGRCRQGQEGQGRRPEGRGQEEGEARRRPQGRRRARHPRSSAAPRTPPRGSASDERQLAPPHRPGHRLRRVRRRLRKAQVGDAYVSGGTGPNSWDCSGLVQAAFRQVGVDLPRVSQDQSTFGTQVSLTASSRATSCTGAARQRVPRRDLRRRRPVRRRPELRHGRRREAPWATTRRTGAVRVL